MSSLSGGCCATEARGKKARERCRLHEAGNSDMRINKDGGKRREWRGEGDKVLGRRGLRRGVGREIRRGGDHTPRDEGCDGEEETQPHLRSLHTPPRDFRSAAGGRDAARALSQHPSLHLQGPSIPQEPGQWSHAIDSRMKRSSKGLRSDTGACAYQTRARGTGVGGGHGTLNKHTKNGLFL